MNDSPTARTLAIAWILIGSLGVLVWYAATALAVGPAVGTRVAVELSDEAGSPVEGRVQIDGDVRRTGPDGRVSIPVDQPVFGFVVAEGFIDEPVVLSPNAPEVSVSLLASTGSGGDRRVLHFGGDTMLGRRYVDGDAAEGVGSAAEARAVVSDLAPLFRAADLSTVNLETVVGDDLGDPYPGKRFLLSTPTLGLSALEALGTDVVTLGNNHAYDWMDDGLVTTLAELRSAGMAVTGAGSTPDAARAPAMVDVSGLRVATLSYTTVTGDVVNDALPATGDPVPADVDRSDAWQYEPRVVDWVDDWPAMPMLAGDAWRLFERMESELQPDEAARLWGEVAGPRAFPELQDWVARRGHGGAARYSASAVREDIRAARRAGADIVVAHLHGGLQYAPIASEFGVAATRQMAEAGADLVIGHHPHVVQGFDWHDGVPIAHSLGNLVFDQDFTATFQSVVLRVVVDDDGVVDVRAYPIELQAHRPVPVAGESREAIGSVLDARSTPGRVAVRGADGSPVLVEGSGWGGGHLADVGWGWSVRPGAAEASDSCQLLLNGSFEDDAADGERSGRAHWRFSDGVTTVDVPDAADGSRVLRFAEIESGWARPVGRAALPAVRADGQAGQRRVELRFMARGEGEVEVRFDAYRFVDTDPTRAPMSEALGSTETTVSVAYEDWTEYTVTVPTEQLASANAIMPYLRYEGGRGAVVEIDALRLIETRPEPTGCLR